ncbi:MAG: hypothetical protein HFJ48_08030 [Clostridia bacterium]|nr:hypothetical protein [Clostridia bacterium]
MKRENIGYTFILAGQTGEAENFGSSAVRSSITDKIIFGNPSPIEQKMLFPNDIGLMDAHNIAGQGFMKLVGMPYVQRFSIRNAVPSFAEIGEKVKKYMKFDDDE